MRSHVELNGLLEQLAAHQVRPYSTRALSETPDSNYTKIAATMRGKIIEVARRVQDRVLMVNVQRCQQFYYSSTS